MASSLSPHPTSVQPSIRSSYDLHPVPPRLVSLRRRRQPTSPDIGSSRFSRSDTKSYWIFTRSTPLMDPAPSKAGTDSRASTMVDVDLGNQSYPIYIGSGLLDEPNLLQRWMLRLIIAILMIDSPREVIGAVLKHMGASYNTEDIESHVAGGKEAVLHNLTMLQKQVRLFDSVHYLKAFAAGDAWVAVGWSSDVIPAAKRMSNMAVIVPKSGASLWADLWAVPAASRFPSNQMGGRGRGPSPLIHQWIEFCLQTARGLPF